MLYLTYTWLVGIYVQEDTVNFQIFIINSKRNFKDFRSRNYLENGPSRKDLLRLLIK